MIRSVKFALGAVVTGVLVAGCGSTPASTGEDTGNGNFQVMHLKADGKMVTCLFWNGYKEGALSCDWANAK